MRLSPSRNQGDLRMFVVDVLRYDIENVASILRLLNSRSCIGWRQFRDRDFTSDEVTSALRDLAHAKMVLVLSEDQQSATLVRDPNLENFDSRINSLWFRLTKKGKEVWERWTPPEEPTGSE